MNRIKELRKKNHLTQYELGILLNLSQQQVQKYETGTLELKPSVLIALADLFHTSTDYILMRTDSMSSISASSIVLDEAEQELLHTFRSIDLKNKHYLIQLIHLHNTI